MISKTPYFCFELGIQPAESRKKTSKQRSNFTSFVSSNSKIPCAFNTQMSHWARELKVWYQKSSKKQLSEMASKLIRVFLGVQCPDCCPAPFFNKWQYQTGKHFTPTLSFPWHREVSDSVLTCTASPWCLCKQIPTRYTKIISLPLSKYARLIFYVWNITQKSRSTLPISWNSLDVKASPFPSLCVYLGRAHGSKDTLDLILSLRTSAACQGTGWIELGAKSHCSEAEKSPTAAASLFLMLPVPKFGMLDPGSLYSLQILTLKSLITTHSTFTRALPGYWTSSELCSRKKVSKGKFLAAAPQLSGAAEAGQALQTHPHCTIYQKTNRSCIWIHKVIIKYIYISLGFITWDVSHVFYLQIFEITIK